MNKIKKILLFLIFVSMVVGLTLFLQHDVYEFDDYKQSFFRTFDIKNNLMFADHAKYLSVFCMKLLCHTTSILLGIHPNENVIPRIAIGFDFAILAYLYAKIYAISNKIRSVNPFIFISAFFVCLMLTLVHTDYLIRWNQHFDYIFTFIFLMIFVITVGKYFFNGKIPDKKDNLKNIGIIILLALSSYINIYVALCVFGFITIYLKKIYKISFKKILVDEKYSTIRLVVLIFLLANLFVVANPNLLGITDSRLGGEINVLEYTIYWFKSLFLTKLAIMLNLLFAGCIVASFVRNKKITRELMLACVIFVASLTFQYLLIICGKTYLYQYYWVSFPRVYLVHYYFVLISISILLGELVFKKEWIVLLITSLMFIACVNQFVKIYKQSINIRKELYMVNKSVEFYSKNKKNNYAIIPKHYVDWDEDLLKDEQNQTWVMNDFCINFYDINKRRALLLKIYPTEIFLKKAQNDGLTFTPEELEKSDFNNFLNR